MIAERQCDRAASPEFNFLVKQREGWACLDVPPCRAYFRGALLARPSCLSPWPEAGWCWVIPGASQPPWEQQPPRTGQMSKASCRAQHVCPPCCCPFWCCPVFSQNGRSGVNTNTGVTRAANISFSLCVLWSPHAFFPLFPFLFGVDVSL